MSNNDDERELTAAAGEREARAARESDEPIELTSAEPESPEREKSTGAESAASSEPIAARRKRGPSRAAALVGARVIVGLAGLGVAAVAIAGSALVPLPTIEGEPLAVNVQPEATVHELVCPGGVLRLGDEIGQNAGDATSVGRPLVASGTTGGDGATDFLNGATSDRASAPAVITAEPVGGEAPLVAASQSQIVANGDLRGLATASCSTPSNVAWLVGGATTVGRTTLLSLSNPSDVVANVSLRIWGEQGAIKGAGLTDISVQPRSQRVIPLSGLAPDLESPVIRVSSEGGRIVASLQQAVVRGIEPGGIEIIGAASGASREIVIPGVLIVGGEIVEQAVGGPGYGDLGTVIRVLVSGTEATEVSVTVRQENGSAAGETFSLEVEGGVVTELPIQELTDGSYSVEVTADVPLVAGVRYSTFAAKPAADKFRLSDFAWASASPVLPDRAMFAAPEASTSVLHVSNPTDAAITATLEPQSGDSSTLSVAAGASTTVELIASTTYELSGAAGLHAAVSSVDGGLVSAFTVLAPAVASSPLTVYPR